MDGCSSLCKYHCSPPPLQSIYAGIHNIAHLTLAPVLRAPVSSFEYLVLPGLLSLPTRHSPYLRESINLASMRLLLSCERQDPTFEILLVASCLRKPSSLFKYVRQSMNSASMRLLLSGERKDPISKFCWLRAL